MPEVNFTITDNADWVFPWQLVDRSTNAGVDLTGSTFQLDVRAAPGGTLVKSYTSGAGIAADSLPDGEITNTFTRGDLAVGSYVYDLIRIQGAATELIFSGSITVEQGVTEV